jgi:hypothetical protein
MGFALSHPGIALAPQLFGSALLAGPYIRAFLLHPHPTRHSTGYQWQYQAASKMQEGMQISTTKPSVEVHNL